MTNLIERMAARLGECEDALSRVRREASGAEQAIQRAQTALGDIERHWRAESPAQRAEEGKDVDDRPDCEPGNHQPWCRQYAPPADAFPRAPRDDAEREACRMSAGANQCASVRRCWRDDGHSGDHVAAGYGINGIEVLARWPSSPATPRELTEATPAVGSMWRGVATGRLGRVALVDGTRAILVLVEARDGWRSGAEWTEEVSTLLNPRYFAPVSRPNPAPTLIDELRAMSAAWLETEQACERIRDTAGAFAWARARGGIEALIAKHSGGGK